MDWNRRLIAICCLLPALVAGCSHGRSGLEGTTWMYEQPESGEATVSLAPEDVTITFGPDGVISGTYTYLTYGGRYTDDGATLHISDLKWTSEVCGRELGLEGPEAYLEALGQADRYRVDEGRMEVDAADQQLVFLESPER